MTMDGTCTLLYIYFFKSWGTCIFLNLNMTYTRSTGNTWNHGLAGCFTNLIMLPTIYAVAFAVFSFSHVFFSHSEFNTAAASINLPELCQIGGNLNIMIMYPNIVTCTNANLYVYKNCVAGNFDDQINSACNEKHRIISVYRCRNIHFLFLVWNKYRLTSYMCAELLFKHSMKS